MPTQQNCHYHFRKWRLCPMRDSLMLKSSLFCWHSSLNSNLCRVLNRRALKKTYWSYPTYLWAPLGCPLLSYLYMSSWRFIFCHCSYLLWSTTCYANYSKGSSSEVCPWLTAYLAKFLSKCHCSTLSQSIWRWNKAGISLALARLFQNQSRFYSLRLFKSILKLSYR